MDTDNSDERPLATASHTQPWYPMWIIVPAGERGDWRVEHFGVDEALAARERVQHKGDPFCLTPPGNYAVLFQRQPDGTDQVYMTDTRGELESCTPLIEHAVGRVLIAGLGLGAVLWPLMDNLSITRITVVEKYAEVIDLVGSTLSWHPRSRIIEIVHADIWDWEPPAGVLYDTIYFDIWPDRVIANLNEIERLHQRGRAWLNRGNALCWMDSWYRVELQRKSRRERSFVRHLEEHMQRVFARAGQSAADAEAEFMSRVENFDPATAQLMIQKLGGTIKNVHICHVSEIGE